MKKKLKKWQLVILISVLVFLVGGVKAYLVAKAHTWERPDVEFKSMMFLGVWGVSIRYPGGGIEPTETIFVTPVLPIVTGRQMTKEEGF